MAITTYTSPSSGLLAASSKSMPDEETTPFKIFPTMNKINSPYQPIHDGLSSDPTVLNPDLILGGDVTADDFILGGNQTEFPPVEIQIISLDSWDKIIVFIIKALLMGAVILTSVFGNLLVIVSVARYLFV